jgi:predicted AlkP superfamily pyrophosphatase or phosphodiesterase
VLAVIAALHTGPLIASQPDLVLMITVDQLRGDMPERFKDRLSGGGFRYLAENGITYTNAHFNHMVTTTAAGHATLATGGNPPQHGIAANVWFDVESRQSVYNTEDPRYPVLDELARSLGGRSPHKLTSTTFGDQLVMASAGNSRTFSVSIKDRGAIIPGGRLGKAYWYSQYSGKFTTSTFYHEEEPAWLKKWNGERRADAYRDQHWKLLLDRKSYLFKDQDDRWYERPEGTLGRTFPHPLNHEIDAVYYSALRNTPMGDELTLSVVKALFSAEKIGQSGHTDLLAISFSATDYVGHAFGPNSLEAEDNLLRLDLTLQNLLQFIDRQVGLENTLIVLSSDHGISPAPEYAAGLGFEAGRHDAPRLMERINTALQEEFETDARLALAWETPSIYLDVSAVAELGLDVATVEQAIAEAVMREPGFTLALTRSDLIAGRVPETEPARLVSNSFHPQRSGHVMLVQDLFWYLASVPEEDAAKHGSPYNYDTHVPIFIAGPGIGHGTVDRRVAPRDIAPTITTYLGILAPSGSIGTPLPGIRAPSRH